MEFNKNQRYGFRGPNPVRTKIDVNGKSVVQIRDFNYLGRGISYVRDIDKMLLKFQIICVTLSRPLIKYVERDEYEIVLSISCSFIVICKKAGE